VPALPKVNVVVDVVAYISPVIPDVPPAPDVPEVAVLAIYPINERNLYASTISPVTTPLYIVTVVPLLSSYSTAVNLAPLIYISI